jgi:PAS domain S-box-containing protein
MTGYSRDELVTSVTTSDLTHEHDRTADQDLLAKSLAGETPHYTTEKRYRRKDGNIIWVRVSAEPIRDDDGRVIQSAGVIEDITDSRRAQDDLRKNEERMALALQAP